MGEKIRSNAVGDIEGFDEATGEILWTQKKKSHYKDGVPRKLDGPGRGRRPRKDTHHWVMDGDGTAHWVPLGTNADHLPRTEWPYSEVHCRQILGFITDGATLKEIGKTKGLPPVAVIQAWARKYPEFKAELKLAREARAESYHDDIMALVKDTNHFSARANRVKMAALQWGAEVGDPDTYGKKTKLSGDPNAPLTFILDTGIRRDEDAIEAQGGPVLSLEDKSS